MLWLRYALLTGRLFKSLDAIYAEYLESPGTKAYSIGQARKVFCRFRSVDITTVLSHGDLLSSAAGQRHRGLILTVARKLFPRRLLKKVLPNQDLFMLVNLKK